MEDKILTALTDMASRLNALEEKVDSMHVLYHAHPHVPHGGEVDERSGSGMGSRPSLRGGAGGGTTSSTGSVPPQSQGSAKVSPANEQQQQPFGASNLSTVHAPRRYMQHDRLLM